MLTMENTKLPELITLAEASKYLKVHPNTLRQWDKKGTLVAIRIGAKKIRMYKKEDVESLINNKPEVANTNLVDGQIKLIKDIIQSSNLNFLIGSGLSTPFLPLLNDIETRLDNAKNKKQRYEISKEYFEKVMLPNKSILNKEFANTAEATKYLGVITQYKIFLNQVSEIMFDRKGTILCKQANIFTTNIDIFIEQALEENNLEYNDGFSGKLTPTFNISNFKKTIHKRSLHFENVSEIPTFNLVKVHGSLTWKQSNKDEEITFSRLSHFDSGLLSKKTGDFEQEYEKILIVNPERTKLQKTVLEVKYYELLRLYSGELEKENSVLFVLGFSMEDQHIKEITLRSANSNPTLTVFIFCHSKNNVADLKKKIGKPRYNNIEIIEPVDDDPNNKLDLEKINKILFSKILDSEGTSPESNEQP
jgi:excisionase family DNA binding protein